MYNIITVKDVIRVSPEFFGEDLNKAVEKSLQVYYEGKFEPRTGIVLSVGSIDELGEGKVIPEDGSAYYPAKFKLLVFIPEEYEVVIGEVVDITEFGAFIRIGPMDGLVHVSQIMNDYVTYDEKNSQFIGRTSKKMLKEGDVVRARIISISYSEENKVGLTMRQPGLGATHWLESEEKPKKPNFKKRETKKGRYIGKRKGM